MFLSKVERGPGGLTCSWDDPQRFCFHEEQSESDDLDVEDAFERPHHRLAGHGGSDHARGFERGERPDDGDKRGPLALEDVGDHRRGVEVLHLILPERGAVRHLFERSGFQAGDDAR